MAEDSRTRDLVVAIGSYAYIQDRNTGAIRTVVGPKKITLDVNDTPVVYEGRSKFRPLADPNAAVKTSYVIPEGHYCVLVNPSADPERQHPREASNAEPPPLQIGNKIVIETATMFALWPGQTADIIRGHQLRSNEYLICRVYNEEEARKNASKARIVLAQGETSSENQMTSDYTVGQLIIINGKQVSFYIPPTGISVLRDEDDKYVREAVTLEQLEYCVLLDEGGKKRFERGPAVVFPTATETFMRKNDQVKFRAIELNDIQGIHIKCTETYKDEVLGREVKEGEEIFITGKQYPIYFPREQHAIIKYDGKEVHYATQIPRGEGRYILNRKTGDIRMDTGPSMLLPNPVDEVIVRRVLSDQECSLWYPANNDVLEYNHILQELSTKSPTTRGGAVTEGELTRATRSAKGARGAAVATASIGNSLEMAAQRSTVGSSYGMGAGMGDEIDRSATYTTPRTLTLNTKMQGVPRIAIWPGYAVRVEDSTGKIRIEVGPKVVLLQYDEILSIMQFSTGTPKISDKPIQTPYLRIANNKVTDKFWVESADHVRMELTISYLISFDESALDSWFNIDNYIKYMTDVTRAEMSRAARRTNIMDLHQNLLNTIEMTLLDDENPETGERFRVFEENGMRISSLELRNVAISDQNIAQLLIGSQQQVVTDSIAVKMAERTKETRVAMETNNTEMASAIAEQAKLKADADIKVQGEQDRIAKAQHDSELARTEEVKIINEKNEDIADMEAQRALARSQAEADFEEQRMRNRSSIALSAVSAEADAVVKRFNAVQPGTIEALMYMSNADTQARIAKAASVHSLLGAENLLELIQQTLQPFANGQAGDVLKSVSERVLGHKSDQTDHR